jgi:hypothetical protein
MKIPLSPSILLVAVFLVIVVHAPAYGACSNDSFTITTLAGTSTAMGDATATIPVLVNNAATSSDPVLFVHVEFDASVYNFSLLTVPPTGWDISAYKNAGGGRTWVEYTATTGGIPVGGSQLFNIVITGTNNDPIPSAAADVSTDSLDSRTVVKNGGCTFTQTGGYPTWTRRALAASIAATPRSVGAGDTITVVLTVTNRSTVSQTVRPSPSNPGITGTAGATLTSSPSAPWPSVAVGSSTTFQWLYTATGSGSLQFCDAAIAASGGPATSNTVCSSNIAVGDFTAFITVSPSQVVSGQNVTVIMTVTNNGSSAIQDIVPTLNALTQPGASALPVSGPTPITITKINHAASSTFQWVYTLTGSVGQTFTFTGYATDKNSLNSVPNPAVSNAVTMFNYAVAASPAQVSSGSSGILTFHLSNNGALTVDQVKIHAPAGFTDGAGTPACGDAAPALAGPPIVTTYQPTTVAAGSSCDFPVAYTAPAVGINTDYNFIVDIFDAGSGLAPRGSLGVIVTVTPFGVTVTASPASINPNCISTLTAVVTPDPGNGSTVNFYETAGTLTPPTTTTTGGQGISNLTAPFPYDAGNTSGTITATYQGASGSVVVQFVNIGGPCLTGVRLLDWQEVVR